MSRVTSFSLLLLLGLVFSQTIFPAVLDTVVYSKTILDLLTTTGLAYIMFFVGLEFDIKKKDIKNYRWDYLVAFTAAAFPWIFTSLYFLFTLFPLSQWGETEVLKEVIFLGRFSSPTSAGILFSMLASANLSKTWVYEKIRVLAIFDDLDTVLLLIPLQIIVVGYSWQLGFILFAMVMICYFTWLWLRKINLRLDGLYPFFYSILISSFCMGIYYSSKFINPDVPIHLEVLFPAFVLGLMIRITKKREKEIHKHEFDLTIVGGIFIFLVGLNMPYTLNQFDGYTSSDWWTLGFHVLMVTILSNLGKMFILCFYRKESNFKERLAICIGMLPRGEVGAGILMLAIGYGFNGIVLTIAMCSLALNLLMTGIFIYFVKALSPAFQAHYKSA